MNHRALIPGLVVTFALVGCSAATSDITPTPEPSSTSATAEPPVSDPLPSPSESDDTSSPSATAPVGCDLVTADLVRQYLRVEPGACEPITSWADGPAGLYPAITMAIDTTASAATIMPPEVCAGGGIDGALPVPGADYGYAVEGDLCVVKGSVGVKTSALLDQDATTPEDWQALAIALVGLL